MPRFIDRRALIEAIDNLHEAAATCGDTPLEELADGVSTALGWDFEAEPDGPDGPWLKSALADLLR